MSPIWSVRPCGPGEFQDPATQLSHNVRYRVGDLADPFSWESYLVKRVIGSLFVLSPIGQKQAIQHYWKCRGFFYFDSENQQKLSVPGALVMVQPHAATDLNMIPPRTDLATPSGRVNFLEVNGTASLAGGTDGRSAFAGSLGQQTIRDTQIAAANPETQYLDLDRQTTSSAASSADVSNSVKRVLGDTSGMSAAQQADFQKSLDMPQKNPNVVLFFGILFLLALLFD